MGENMHNNVVYVAVSGDVRESKKTLLWTLKNLHPKNLCLLHVHIPISFDPSPSWLNESEKEGSQKSEVNNAMNSFYKYRDICVNNGINEEDVDISMTSGYDVGKGIVELIYQNNIKKLVMGAAADPHYSRGMNITSRKAEYVSQHAPQTCKMWFICQGKLIKTKQGRRPRGEPEFVTPPVKEKEPPVQPPNKGNRAGSSPVSDEPPEKFICPISMEIMRDPHIAADGFTYEAEQIRTWFRDGRQTSPCTNESLANQHLIPNHTLRSMIQDWLQQHPNYNAD